MLQKHYIEKKQKQSIVFMDMAKSLKNILKKFISYFHTKQKFKNYVLACIFFALITNLIKS
jgi:hypothetical protein